MVTEIVFFDLPRGTNRAEALALYRQSAGQWVNNPDLFEKYYFFDEERCLGGGVYVWRTREAAKRWHGDAYRAMVEKRYGTPPRIEILEALVRVDPTAKRVEEL